MQSNKERRVESWNLMWKGGWFFRLFAIGLIFTMINFGVQTMTSVAYTISSISDVQTVQAEVASARKENREPNIERSPYYVLHVVGATMFELFILWIVAAIGKFGTARAHLRAARHEDKSTAFDGVFAGFRMPLGMWWLFVREIVQIMLWSCLLYIPGIIAFYRYILAWFVKSDHSDWSAGKCLAESGRLMKGEKWNLFLFQCSFWRQVLVIAIPLFAGYAAVVGIILSAIAAKDGESAVCYLIILACSLVVVVALLAFIALVAVFSTQVTLGTAIFYRELVARDARAAGIPE